MPSPTKKRHNAFEDFPEANRDVKIKLGDKTDTSQQQPVERIERLKPSQMMPDRFQPRRLLPPAIRDDFFNHRLDCYAAASAWLALGEQDEGIREEINGLMSMGESFKEHGQIKPITGSWLHLADGSFVFQIETGERRFWAACLKKAKHKDTEEPILRVEVVSHPTRQRQVLENRHAETPSAVEQACEVSALILSEIGIHPSGDISDEYDYFRQVQNQRMPAGLWDKIIPIMQLTRPRMVQLLNILQMPSSLLDMADRYRLPERVLREILSAPKEQWESMLSLSIRSNLTADEIASITDTPVITTTPEETKRKTIIPVRPARDAVKSLRHFSRMMESLLPSERNQVIDALADDLMVQGRGESMLLWMTDLVHLLQARLKRK